MQRWCRHSLLRLRLRLRLPRQERRIELPIRRRRSEMPRRDLTTVVELRRLQMRISGCGCNHLLLLLKRRDWDKRRHEMVGAVRVKEMSRHGRAREEPIRRRIRSASAAGRQPSSLHPLEVKPILLQMARDVLSRQPVDAHELHNRLGNGVLDPEMRHRVDEAFVQLRRPHEARPLQGPRRLVSGAAEI